MDYLIALLSSFVVFLSFKFFERHRLNVHFYDYLILTLYVVLISFVIKPSDHFVLWLIFILLIYSTFDDFKSNTIHIYLPLFASILIVLFHSNTNITLFDFFIFFSFLIIAKQTKEKIIGEGDVYFCIPLLFLTDGLSFLILCHFGFLTALCFFILSIFTKKERIPFTPILFLSYVALQSEFLTNFLLQSTFYIYIIFYFFFFYKKLKRC